MSQNYKKANVKVSIGYTEKKSVQKTVQVLRPYRETESGTWVDGEPYITRPEIWDRIE